MIFSSVTFSDRKETTAPQCSALRCGAGGLRGPQKLPCVMSTRLSLQSQVSKKPKLLCLPYYNWTFNTGFHSKQEVLIFSLAIWNLPPFPWVVQFWRTSHGMGVEPGRCSLVAMEMQAFSAQGISLALYALHEDRQNPSA